MVTEEPEHGANNKRRFDLQKAWPLFRRFWPYLRPERKAAALIGLLLTIGIAPAIASPLLVRHLFDVVLPASDLNRIFLLAAAMIGLGLASGLLAYLRGLVSIGLRNRVRFRLIRQLFARVLRLPLEYFDRTSTGYLMSRVRDDVAALDNLMIDQLVEAMVNVIKALIFLFLLLFLDVGLALSGVLLLAAILGTVLVVSPAIRRRSEVAREADAKSSAALHEALTGISTVRTSGQTRREGQRYWSRVKSSIRASAHRDVLSTLSSTLFGLVATLGTYVIVAVGAYRISAGASSFGNLFAFFLFLMQLMSSTTSVFYLVPGIQRSLASLQRIFELLDQPLEIEPTPTTAGHGASTANEPESPAIEGRIELQGVVMRYASGPLALDGIDLVVEPGETLALVGRSGAGKSTLGTLLTRLYEPTRGAILLDGRALTSYPLDWLRRQVGVVPQDVFLFDRSVGHNIAYASPNAGSAAIRQAARSAHADEFIDQLPEGYETVIGERGVRLSGGQKQRIAIARELLRDPPILILDEATSHLDAESEALVQDAIGHLLQGRTSFVIAHRLSTVHRADRIVVMDKGKIVAVGTHDQLMAEDGLYRELYQLQLLTGERESLRQGHPAGLPHTSSSPSTNTRRGDL